MNHVEQAFAARLKCREGWKSQTFDGVPARVRFTTGDLRKMTVDRNTLNQITGVKKPPINDKTAINISFRLTA